MHLITELLVAAHEADLERGGSGASPHVPAPAVRQRADRARPRLMHILLSEGREVRAMRRNDDCCNGGCCEATGGACC